MDRARIRQLEQTSLEIKKQLLKLCSIQSIHIGGDLSIVDVMTVLWQSFIKFNPRDPRDETRDRFVLSKGHASAVTCFEQAAIGCFDKEEIYEQYAQDGGKYSMHACNMLNPYVEVSTGSLGHGLAIAAGIAEGLKLKNNKTSRVYVVMGDGEQSEGSVWEAVMNSAQYKLGNLVGIIDFNKLQSDGSILEMTTLGNLPEKYRAFGWNVIEINGHDFEEIVNAFNSLPDASSEVPTAIICNTIKGNGIPEMENNVKWHAGKISEEQYEKYVSLLDEVFRKKWEKYER